ncbi:MAG: NTP transferase domain-containing protein [Myxococcota bacterium]
MLAAVVIPSRLDSRRIPRKALQDLEGLPLIEHVRSRAIAAGVGPVIVATDSPEIAEVVQSFGGDVWTTGPAASGTHRVAEVARRLDRAIFVNVQGDQPRVSPFHIRDLVAHMERSGAEIATVATPLRPGERDDPAVVKVAMHPGTPVARDFRRDDAPGFDHRHLGLYAYTREALLRVTSGPVGTRARAEGLEQLTWLEGGASIHVVLVDAAASSIDTMVQLERARATSSGG